MKKDLFSGKYVNKDVETIEFNYDNLDILKIVSYLLKVIVNDIDYINAESIEIAQDYMIDYDMGNNTYIKKEDLESIVSIIDTINDIISYNKEGVENDK